MRFERSNGLDTALYKTYLFMCVTGRIIRLVVWSTERKRNMISLYSYRSRKNSSRNRCDQQSGSLHLKITFLTGRTTWALLRLERTMNLLCH